MSWLDWVYPKRCLECGRVGRYICLQCRKKIRCKGQSLAYAGIVREAIKAIKYRGSYELIDELIEIWQPNRREAVVITSVPMWEAKKRVRGFNQAELIAKNLAKRWGVRYCELLKRSRETKPMYGLSNSERVVNVKGAFALRLLVEKLPETVLLIDDVWTTGATTNECKEVLIKAGVKRVEVLTLAS